MPPKSKKKDNKAPLKPMPPNIFLYVQLAHMGKLPNTLYPLEIHMNQGDSTIVKCVEHYNTDGIIYQEEFNFKPTFTLIFQQDNLDRINHAADNPLLIELFMRKSNLPYGHNDEEANEEATDVENYLEKLLDHVDVDSNDENLNFVEVKEELVLICVGFLDIIKVFGHHRAMIREELLLYPTSDVPMEMRFSVRSEWHLYTLVPIAKEITFTNMAFVTFESIYNLRDEYSLDVSTMMVQLSFRSAQPITRNEFHVIPWCSFSRLSEQIIDRQNVHHMFEFFANSVENVPCIGLMSNMEVEMYRLFHELMCSENMEVNFQLIDTKEDEALVCNAFHRYILTRQMCDILFTQFAWRNYIILVEIFQDYAEKKPPSKNSPRAQQKIFEGVLDPAIMLFPGVQTIRFAVELKYTGPRKKLSKPKRQMRIVEPADSSQRSSEEHVEPTFAIIRLCLLAPLGDVYTELKVFRESFISQNRLLHCNYAAKEQPKMLIRDLQRDAYARFDVFVRDTVRYIVEKNVHSVQEKRGNFCCALQNLTNILLKVISCDFNMRLRTTTNIEFTNLCTLAFNELELRVHKILEKMEAEGWDELTAEHAQKYDYLIDSMNSFKLLSAAGDTRMANFIYEKQLICPDSFFEYYDLISKMERGDFVNARAFFKKEIVLTPVQDYLSGWIRLFLDYYDTREDPDPAVSANATECLLNSIMGYAMRNDYQMDGWILLYCYYKRFDYSPGFSYARWRLDDLLLNRRPKTNPSTAPYSVWGISLNTSPRFNNRHGNIFYQCFRVFVRLGLYEFAQVIFEDVQFQCSDIDRYLINTQMKILLNQVEDDLELVDVSFIGGGGEEDAFDPVAAFVAQVNGNVEYHRGNFEKAASFYRRNADIDSGGRDYLLSKLRLAYLSFDEGNYHQTIRALNMPEMGKLLPLSCSYLRGKAYYKLEDLTKAMECFSTCTTYGTHVPDVWGFLALINLQMGNNLNAIVCWKYARADPTKRIMDEIIFTELDLIDEDSIDLYIDQPSSLACDSNISLSTFEEN
ncbi:hypothetical protein KR222_010865 [Zaprionus bogoriensis]|nr:hypothetical protein KR222_010865 [Zaprionus bogoriensis]